VGGEAEDRIGADRLSGLLDRDIVLADVDSVGVTAERQVGVIVDDEKDTVGVTEAAESASERSRSRAIEPLLTQLHDVDAAV